MITYLKPEELSARWRGVSIRTLANWRYVKMGPRYVKIGNRVLYALADIERYESAVGISPQTKQTR